jgi:hypothetical protein
LVHHNFIQIYDDVNYSMEKAVVVGSFQNLCGLILDKNKKKVYEKS